MNETVASLPNLPANQPGHARNKRPVSPGPPGVNQAVVRETGDMSVSGRTPQAGQSKQNRPRSYAQAADESRKAASKPERPDGRTRETPGEMAPMAALLQMQAQVRMQTAQETQDTDPETRLMATVAMDAMEAPEVSPDMEVNGPPFPAPSTHSRGDFAKLRQELIKPDKGGNLSDRVPLTAAPDEPAVPDIHTEKRPAHDVLEALNQTVVEKAPEGKELAASFLDMRARLAALSHDVTSASHRPAHNTPDPAEPSAPATLHMAASNEARESAPEEGDDWTNNERPVQTRRAVTNARENQRELFALSQPAGPEPLRASHEAPVTPAQIIRQIVDTTALSQTGNISQIKLQLNPEFLGRVNIVLTSGADGISARIQTQSGAVRDMLTANLFKLEAELRDMGLTMKSIDIVHTSLAGSLSAGQQGFSHGNHESYGPNGTRPVTMARFHQAVRAPVTLAYDDGFGGPYAPRGDSGVDYWA